MTWCFVPCDLEDPRFGKTAALLVFLGSFVCLQRADRKKLDLLQLFYNVGGGFLWLSALGSLEDEKPLYESYETMSRSTSHST